MRFSPYTLTAMRVFLGLLAMFFAYQLGRVGAAVYERGLAWRRGLTWALRTVVTLVGVYYPGGFDRITIVLFVLAAGCCALGVYLEMRPKKVEEIHITPQD